MQVHVEGILHRYGLGVPLGDHGPVVEAQRHPVEPVAVGLADQSYELRLSGLRQVVDGGHAGAPEMVAGGRPDPRQHADRQGGQQIPFGAGLDEDEAVRLGLLRGDLGEHLGARESDGAAETRHRVDGRPQPLPRRAGRGRVVRRPPGLQVHERLVQAQRFHQGRQPSQQAHHLLAHRAVQGEAGHQIRRVGREPPGLRGGHRRVHPEPPGLVRGGGDHAPGSEAAHHDRLAAQTRFSRLLRRRVEGVHVQVEDGGRGSHTVDAALRH